MNTSLGYIAGRVLQAVLTLVAVSVVTFLVLRFLPGQAPAEVLGSGQPGPLAYLAWLGRIFSPGDLAALAAITAPTLELLALSSVVALLAALGLATVQARLAGSLTDRLLGVAANVLYTLPAFWVALMLVWVFADDLPWLPAVGPQPVPSTGLLDWPLHMLLPVVTLALATIASWSTQFRAAIEEALRADYVRTARAKGLPERAVVRRHALRPAILPVITMVGMSLPTMFNNVVAVELVFVMYGLGSALAGIVGNLQSGVSGYLVLVIAAITVLGNLLADLVYVLADPRIQFSD